MHGLEFELRETISQLKLRIEIDEVSHGDTALMEVQLWQR
jgi:hypothetical protein